jgi:hypothetical protein
MLSSSRYLLAALMLLLCNTASKAQEIDRMDYLMHNKYFYVCSYKRQCSNCNDCTNQRYVVKIKNRVDKEITNVRYVYYSAVQNRVITEDAKLEGSLLDAKNTGLLYICVPDGKHWAISEIEYKDGTSYAFVVKGRLNYFDQEPDECDCNPTTYYHSPKDLQ